MSDPAPTRARPRPDPSAFKVARRAVACCCSTPPRCCCSRRSSPASRSTARRGARRGRARRRPQRARSGRRLRGFALPLTRAHARPRGLVLLNALVVTVVVELIPGADDHGLSEAIVVTVGLTLLTALVRLAAGDRRRRRLVPQRRRSRRCAGAARPSRAPSARDRLLLEIDGLAYEIASRARCATGRCRTSPAGCATARTGSSAGRPTGPRRPAPARPGSCTATTTTCRPSAGGRRIAASAIVTNHPRDAAEIERRHSDGRGLLHADGASRANILSGDAPHSMLTMSTVLRPPAAARPRLRRLLRPPYAVARRRSCAALADIARERRAAGPSATPRRAAADRARSRLRGGARLGDRRSSSTSRSRRSSATCSPAGR